VVRVMVFAAGSSLRTQFHRQLHLYPDVTLDTPAGDAWHCNSKQVRVRVLRGTE